MEKKLKIRKRKNEDTLSTHRHVFYLNKIEEDIFLKYYRLSGKKSESKFIASVIMGKPIKIIKIDKTAIDYFAKLTNFYLQFQAIGTNYNQLVKSIKTNLSEKRAQALLIQLEIETKRLFTICQQIVELTKNFESHLNEN